MLVVAWPAMLVVGVGSTTTAVLEVALDEHLVRVLLAVEVPFWNRVKPEDGIAELLIVLGAAVVAALLLEVWEELAATAAAVVAEDLVEEAVADADAATLVADAAPV